MRKKQIIVFSFIIAIIISSCTTLQNMFGEKTDTTLKSYCFICEDVLKEKGSEVADMQFIANYRDNKFVWLFLPDKTLKVPQVVAASGAKYESNDVMFWNKGRDAMVNYKDVEYRCTTDRKCSIWEDAKLRGIDFRAVGNEPGWVLEIAHDWTSFRYDYDSQEVKFKTLKPTSDQAKMRTIYTGHSWQKPIRIELKSEVCTDSMNGEEYETRVKIDYDGRIFEGCGKALH